MEEISLVTKKCSKCKEIQKNSEFRVDKTNNRLHSWCRKCESEWGRKYNKANYVEVKARKDARTAALYELVNDYKRQHPCECGESRLPCLEFHHLDPKKKELPISRAILRCWSKKRLLREVAKCVIVCANCHKLLHANWMRLKKAI